MHSANVHPDFTSHFAAPPPQLELLPQAFLYVAPRSGEKNQTHTMLLLGCKENGLFDRVSVS